MLLASKLSLRDLLCVICLVGVVGGGMLSGLGGCALFEKPSVEPDFLIEPTDAYRLGYRLGPALNLGIPTNQTLAHVKMVHGLLILVESPSNVVTAVDISKGQVKWRRMVGTHSQTLYEPIVYQDRILINAARELFLIDKSDGQVMVNQPLGQSVASHPAIYDTLAIFASDDGIVFGHDIPSGYAHWHQKVSGRSAVPPVIFGSRVFVADMVGMGRLFDALDGTLAWSTSMHQGTVARPLINRRMVFVANQDRSLYCFDRVHGHQRWVARMDHPLKENPVILDDLIFLNSPQQGLKAFLWRSGKLQWTLKNHAQPVDMVKGQVLLNLTDELQMVNAKTGQIASQTHVVPLHTVVHLPSDQLVLITDRGRILRLDPHRK